MFSGIMGMRCRPKTEINTLQRIGKESRMSTLEIILKHIVPALEAIRMELERERRTVILRSQNRPFVKCKVGKESMPDEELADNSEYVLSNLTGALSRGANNVKSVFLKLTMGPAIKVI